MRTIGRFGTAAVVLLAAATLARAAGEAPVSALWSDPTFQKDFLGTFGASPELEPKLSQVERERLAAILPSMATDPDRAIAELEVLTTPEASAMFDYTLATLFFQEERLADAAAYYGAAVRKFPAFRRAHKNLGLLRVRAGEFREALASLGRVIELGGGDGLSYGLLGYAYSATEQWVSAESAYRAAVLLQPDLIDWKLGLTQAVFRQQKYGEAVKLCEDLIAAHPDRTDFLLLQANAFIGLEQPLRAAQNFEIVRRMGAATPASLHTLGDIYTNEALFDLAAAAYGDALAAEPRPPAGQALRDAEVLAQRGALAEARVLLDRVAAAYGDTLGEDERKRMLKLEARIAVAGGDGDEAAEVLRQIVAVDPLDGEALLLLGQHHARAADPERALFYYERAASLGPFEADAKVRQAQLLVGQSRYAEALPLLKRAQELKPRDDVGRYLEQIERAARSRR